MHVFIIGISGGIGRLLAQKLQSRGNRVRGLVRRREQQAEFQQQGVDVEVADLARMTPQALADAFDHADAVVFTAGSNGGRREITKAIDGEGVDDPGIGTVSLGPAEFHDQIARDDVASTLVELLHEPGISRQILELNTGTVPIDDAVRGQAMRYC